MIKEFTVGCSKTVNLGNFQSIRLEASVTYEVPELEDLELAKGKAQQELKNLLAETWKAQRRDEPR